MKHLFTFVFLAALMANGAMAQAQQTPANTVCNEKSGLQWAMNTEPDVKEYKVYVANGPGIATANPPVMPLISVPHDPTTATIDANGNKVVSYSLAVTMSEGDKYITVTALDQVGNESTHSNEIGCEYNTTPNAPFIKLNFTQPKP